MSEPTTETIADSIKAGAQERRGVDERTAVYRFYDADDVLIYVGITKNTVRRWWEHSKKAWWHQIARREVTWLDSRPDALLAERRAVLAVLRESLTHTTEADDIQRQRWAVIFAARIGWSKYQIAAELGVDPPVVILILMTARRDGSD